MAHIQSRETPCSIAIGVRDVNIGTHVKKKRMSKQEILIPDLELVTKAFEYGEKKGRTEQQKHFATICFLDGALEERKQKRADVGSLS